jgi:alkaline phosphatase
VLSAAAREAAANKRRLFGYFGAKKGHLPFRTADGKYDPTYSSIPSSRRVGAADTQLERYSPADLTENPTLADMARAALTVLSTNEKGFWLLVEAGDVDWANHTNNIDDSIGAVISGDEAFRATVEWIEKQPNGWSDTALFLTADHGHYLVLTKPEALVTKRQRD